MKRALVGVVMSLGLPSVAIANCLTAPPVALPHGEPVAISANPVDIPPKRLNGLTPAGAWSLSSDNSDFGGLSGLHMQGSQITAVTDKGHLLHGNVFLQEDGGLEIADALLTALSDDVGSLPGSEAGDAEGLTLFGNKMVISFERQHRIAVLGPEGAMVACAGFADFSDLGFNNGLEGLATTPAGLIALAEGPDRGQADYWVIREDGTAEKGLLTLPTDHLVTGADVGPDGKLYLVLRTYTPVIGVSARIVRYALDDGHPVPKSAEILAEFEGVSGIDNMEGISVTDDFDGDFLWLVSDDNFSFVQRNLLMRFRLD